MITTDINHMPFLVSVDQGCEDIEVLIVSVSFFLLCELYPSDISVEKYMTYRTYKTDV